MFQHEEHHDPGQVTGPDGNSYLRRGTKMSRRQADAMVAAGVPLVLDFYGRDQFEWFDGEDAREIWSEIRPYVTTSDPTARQLAKHAMWTAGLWESSDAALLYLIGRC